MRITIDLPEDIYVIVRELAHQSGKSLSQTVVDMIRAGIGSREQIAPIGPRGLPVISVGRSITADDVRSVEDD